jgi:Tol biopolymer transport system component
VGGPNLLRKGVGFCSGEVQLGRVGASLTSVLVGMVVLAAPAHATFPGKNGKIAFQRGGDVWVVNADGSGQVNLTNSASTEGDPSWSPDGTRIAFSSDRDSTDPECDGYFEPCNYEIYVMNADGTGQTRVTNTASYAEGHPRWSPDGTKVTYSVFSGCDGEPACGVWTETINADGSGRTFFITASFGAERFDAAWSPDGKRLAYAYFNDYNFGVQTDTQLYIANPDGSDNRVFCCENTFARYPDWSPDQRTMLLDAGSRVARQNVDGTGFAYLGDQGTFRGVWSPDGARIAFDKADCSTTPCTTNVEVMNTDGTGETKLTDGLSPSWQPLVGPQRGDYKNAAQFCKAEREFFGDATFGQRYGTNDNGANGFGKCVSSNGG